MNGQISRKLLLGFLGLALLFAAASYGQEQPTFPYFLMVESHVKSGMMPQYIGAVQQIKAAHQKHEKGLGWAAFNNFVGGEGSTYYYFLPMQQVGEMDGWSTEVMVDVHGAEKAAEVQKTMGECSKTTNVLLRYTPELSYPPEGMAGGPPQVVYHLHAKVRPDMIAEYNQAITKIVAAYKKQNKEPHWLTYANQIGGEGPELHIFMGMEKFGDLDGWSDLIETLAAEYGQDGAAEVMTHLDAGAQTSSSILTLALEMSNLGAPQ